MQPCRTRLRAPLPAVLGLLAFACLLSAEEPAPPALVIRNVTVIDTAGGQTQRGMTVLIEGEQIAAVGRKLRAPKGARVLDARGQFLMPGLWDMHVHLSMTGEESLPVLLAHGVTAVRDMGGDFAELRRMRERVNQGELVGPQVFTAGTILESPRFIQVLNYVASKLGPPFGDELKKVAAQRRAVADPDEARAVVESLAAEGVDLLKFRSVASPEVLRALAQAARQAGLRLTGHEPPGIPLAEVAAEIDSLEHVSSPALLSLSADERAALARQLQESGVWLDPTLVAFRTTRLTPESALDAALAGSEPRLPLKLAAHWRLQRELDQFESPVDWPGVYGAALDCLRAAHRAGAGFLAGTDLGARLIYPGSSLHDELELLVGELGLTPAEALQAATLNPARFFGQEASRGTIQAGRRADLVLLEANPLADIRNTRRITAVVLRGQLFDRAALHRLVAAAGDAPNPPAGE